VYSTVGDLILLFFLHIEHANWRRELIQELSGDSRRDAIDIYDDIDLRELKEAY
jgi:hypothetical protein